MKVAIVGGPGIGKSTLVRQLGDLYHHGSYGEGEEGVWDRRVLEDLAPRPGHLRRGARITLEAHIPEYPPASHTELRRVLAIGDPWHFDGSSC